MVPSLEPPAEEPPAPDESRTLARKPHRANTHNPHNSAGTQHQPPTSSQTRQCPSIRGVLPLPAVCGATATARTHGAPLPVPSIRMRHLYSSAGRTHTRTAYDSATARTSPALALSPRAAAATSVPPPRPNLLHPRGSTHHEHARRRNSDSESAGVSSPHPRTRSPPAMTRHPELLVGRQRNVDGFAAPHGHT
ncbi:hypothetical protein PYCCODRAFT_472842 [Trametes coccinea BRFM310]|uniref:Uncharacterized protein n=1 Tax=Trametes coccinea (strain BRFM310) TaxID=1353009 RepID=A0A1Y2IKW3_TRAC3|nr:hypothetical protein PYCCODRAFT_472842 [Trametes coccinea BRFM310]